MADYVIRSGDVLSVLAQRFGTTVQALAQLNGISNPDRISAGATIRVPDGAGAAPPRPATAPVPTTGAVPRPRPQQIAAMDPMAAPLPNPNPERGPMPLPRPNVERPGGMQQAQLMASSDREMALQQQQEQERLRMQQQDARMRQQPQAMPAAPQQPSFISPQMASYAAGSRPPMDPGARGRGGLPYLPNVSMNELNQMRIDSASQRWPQEMKTALEQESQRRVAQLRAELVRLDQSNGMRYMRQAAWQNAGQQMPRTQGPQIPPSIPGSGASPMPQGQPMAGVPLDPYGPAQLQGWEARQGTGAPIQPQMDPVAALIQALRSGGGQGGQSNNPMLMRLLQGS